MNKLCDYVFQMSIFDSCSVERLYYGHPWDWPFVAVIEAWP